MGTLTPPLHHHPRRHPSIRPSYRSFYPKSNSLGDMKVVGLAVALVAVLVVMSCLAPNSGAEAQSSSWDFLLLVQQWGPGVCATSRGKQCVIPSYVRYWTLHRSNTLESFWEHEFEK